MKAASRDIDNGATVMSTSSASSSDTVLPQSLGTDGSSVGARADKASGEVWLVVLVLVGSAAATAVLDPYALKLLGKVLILWIVGLGLQALVSHAGVISLGHAAFLACGAYVAGILSLAGMHNVFLMLACVIAANALLGLVMGALVLRAQGLYQLMATLAMAQMMYYGFQSLRSLGGNDGFAVPVRPDVWNGWLPLDSDQAFGFFIVLVAALAVWFSERLNRSEAGAMMRATRDDETRVASLGTNPYWIKLLAFLISAVLAGLAGALMAHLSRFASPQLGHWMMSGELVILVLLGGASTRVGLFGAAAAVIAIQELLSQYTDHWPLALGVVVLLRVLWPSRPKGGRP